MTNKPQIIVSSADVEAWKLEMEEIDRSVERMTARRARLVRLIDAANFLFAAMERQAERAKPEAPPPSIDVALDALKPVHADPLEEAATLRRLRDEGISTAEIAERIGRTQRFVQQRLKLLEAAPQPDIPVEGPPEPVQADMAAAAPTEREVPETPPEPPQKPKRRDMSLFGNLDRLWLTGDVTFDQLYACLNHDKYGRKQMEKDLAGFGQTGTLLRLRFHNGESYIIPPAGKPMPPGSIFGADGKVLAPADPVKRLNEPRPITPGRDVTARLMGDPTNGAPRPGMMFDKEIAAHNQRILGRLKVKPPEEVA